MPVPPTLPQKWGIPGSEDVRLGRFGSQRLDPVGVPVGGRPRDAAGHAQVSRQAKHYAHRGINALMSCDKAFQNPCHSAKRERKYVQQHIRICTHGVKTGLG